MAGWMGDNCDQRKNIWEQKDNISKSMLKLFIVIEKKNLFRDPVTQIDWVRFLFTVYKTSFQMNVKEEGI